MRITTRKRIGIGIALIALGVLLWYFRSWNLVIGDGEFCCKQTAGPHPFPVTLSRCPLAHLLYRAVFFTIHPLWNWWVEDCIALCSCAAGILFFWSLIRYALAAAGNWVDFFLFFLFPSSSLLLQVFCGHIEFYPWTCALLMLSAYLAWRSIQDGISLWWPSAAMMLAAAFHSSAVFYFPALLFLPLLSQKKDGERLWPEKSTWLTLAAVFGLFIVTAMLHRKPYWFTMIPVPLYLIEIGLGIYVFTLLPDSIKTRLKPYWPVYIPWLVMFTIRAAFGLRAEPLLEHLPPLGEPYDHGAYLYEAFSWDHLYDKTMFHLWLVPFGLISFLAGFLFFRKTIFQNRWLFFLFHLSIWALIWSTLFYPQLRLRDWDLFATIAIPLNLFTAYLWYRVFNPSWFRGIITLMIVIQFAISLPIIWDNSSLGVDRGYVTVTYAPKPVECRAFIRGLLLLETTPVTQPNIRAGMANVRLVPLERGHASWEQDIDLRPGKEYLFDPRLEEIEVPPIPGR